MATRASRPRVKPTRKPATNDLNYVPQFPDEWISLAAYYIWKNEGEPEGQDLHYWERAKVELAELWKNGTLERFK